MTDTLSCKKSSPLNRYDFLSSIIDLPNETTYASSFTFQLSPLEPVLAEHQAGGNTPLQQALEQAKFSLQNRNVSEARSLLQQQIEQNGALPLLHYGLAVCSVMEGEVLAAERSLKEELKQSVSPSVVHALRYHINSLLKPEPIDHRMATAQTSMVTLFTHQQDFEGLAGVLQRNAMNSWNQLPDCAIVLIGDNQGVAEVAEEYGCLHIPTVLTNDYGTPLLSDMIRLVNEFSHSPYLAYLNPRLIIFEELISSIRKSSQQFHNFLLTGRQWDLSLQEQLNFIQPEVRNELRERCVHTGVLHPEVSGYEYLAFRRGFYDEIPDFVVGRGAYDRWFISDARFRNAPVIDGTRSVFAILQNQDKSQCHKKLSVSHYEMSKNHELSHSRFFYGDCKFADYAIVNGEIVRKERSTLTKSEKKQVKNTQFSHLALEAINKRQFHEALQFFAKIEANGSIPQGMFQAQAALHEAMGNAQMAKSMIQKELELFPGNLEARAKFSQIAPHEAEQLRSQVVIPCFTAWQHMLFHQIIETVSGVHHVLCLGATLNSLALATFCRNRYPLYTFLIQNQKEIAEVNHYMEQLQFNVRHRTFPETEIHHVIDSSPPFDLIFIDKELLETVNDLVKAHLSENGIIIVPTADEQFSYRWETDAYLASVHSNRIFNHLQIPTGLSFITRSARQFQVARALFSSLAEQDSDIDLRLKSFPEVDAIEKEELIIKNRQELLAHY